MCRVVLPFITATQWVDAIATAKIPAISPEIPTIPVAEVPAISATERIDAVTTANVGIAIEIVVAVNVDVAATPTTTPAPTTTPEEAHRDSYSKRDCSGRIPCSVIRRVVDCRIRVDGWSPDVHRVV